MANGEHLPPGYGPIGLASSDGFPWARLVTGLFAVTMTLGMGWRVARPPVETARIEVPLPVETARIEASLPEQEQASLAQPLAPGQPAVMKAAVLTESFSPPIAQEQAARPLPAIGPSASPRRHQFQRASRMQSHAAVHRKAGPALRPIDPRQIARAKLTRTRSDVRNEYIGAREQVAALTSEDSGSAYLTRLAARQTAKRAGLAGYAQNRHSSSRRASTRT